LVGTELERPGPASGLTWHDITGADNASS
jgi:hypothetical protein